MQNKTDILISLINESGLKPKQKTLAFDCIAKIVTQYNLIEGKYQRRIKQDNKIKSDFIDYYDRVYTLLYILNINELDVIGLNYKYTEWVKQNIGDSTKQLSFDAIEKIFAYLELYENCYDGKIPDNMQNLKSFILEPLNITEENFQESLKQALHQFTKDHIVTDIIKIGWAKEIMGCIKTKKNAN